MSLPKPLHGQDKPPALQSGLSGGRLGSSLSPCVAQESSVSVPDLFWGFILRKMPCLPSLTGDFSIYFWHLQKDFSVLAIYVLISDVFYLTFLCAVVEDELFLTTSISEKPNSLCTKIHKQTRWMIIQIYLIFPDLSNLSCKIRRVHFYLYIRVKIT